MKKISMVSLALTFAGCFLGAGYVSGKELYQYFGAYGNEGYIGLAIALALQLIFGLLIIFLCKKTGLFELDKLIIRWDNKAVRAIVGGVSLVFMFGVFVIMAAGAGSLINRVTGLDYTISCLIFCVLVTVIAGFGVNGMVKAFSAIVPVLTVFTVIISVLCISQGSLQGGAVEVKTNPLLGGWLLSAVNYTSYNMFGTIGIIAPVALMIKQKKTAITGVAMGSGVLMLIALSIIACLAVFPSFASAELPMLEAAYSLNAVVGIIYALLLLLAMTGTSMSSLIAVNEYLAKKSALLSRNKLLFSVILGAGAFALSLVGFGELISLIYPICGYLGIAAFALIAEHFIHISRKKLK